MRLEERINAFSRLSKVIESMSAAEWNEVCDRALLENSWFTSDAITLAIKAILIFLSKPALEQWTSSYALEPPQPRTIGAVMAGNIPLVGFHDFLSVLISGHRLKAKLSSQDSVLLTHLAHRLVALEPTFRELIQFEERLTQVDALIATGSNNTARYFEYYFRNVPHLIRKNRASCAVLSGDESANELTELGLDVFSYFGLGCRNVSKLFVPALYDFQFLLSCWKKYETIIQHSKYRHNYDYQKSILLVNQIPFYDNGFILLKEDSSLVSPVSVLFYESYTDSGDLRRKIENHLGEIQCMVSSQQRFSGSEAFGKTQFPRVSDYADGVDTLRFLEGL